MSSAPQVLARFAEAAELEELGVHGVHVLLGDEQAQHRWHDDVRENVFSVSKGVSALAAGIAIDEGLLHLDSSVSELLPDLALGGGVEQIHLRHLLTMTSGIDFQWFGSQPVPWTDLAGPKTCWRLDGANGQYIIVDQTRHAVITITAHEPTRDHRLAELAVEALNAID